MHQYRDWVCFRVMLPCSRRRLPSLFASPRALCLYAQRCTRSGAEQRTFDITYVAGVPPFKPDNSKCTIILLRTMVRSIQQRSVGSPKVLPSPKEISSLLRNVMNKKSH